MILILKPSSAIRNFANLRIGIIGAGTVGTDLLRRLSERPGLEVVLVADQDPAAPGLALATQKGLSTSTQALEAVLAAEDPPEIVFVTAAGAGDSSLAAGSIRVVDLTPAGSGVIVVPSVNLEAVDGAAVVGLATPAAQVAVPLVAAIGDVAPVAYAEVVSTLASAALGAGARRSIDATLEATAAALRHPGRAAVGKAVALVSPAQPPPPMRVTLLCLLPVGSDRTALEQAVATAIASLAGRVPGCRLVTGPLVEETDEEQLRLSVVVEVTAGMGGALPSHAGHVELLTRAAVEVGERVAHGQVAIT
jgi:acetaldehyde dehydrogenase (acetylating)